MSELISRRSMLALSAAGALAVALPACSGPHQGAQPSGEQSGEQNDDPQDLDSFGYDPDADEAGTPEAPQRLDNVPAASVHTEWLPPVGNQQSLGSCFIWSAIYGLATFHAARKSQTPPKTPDLVPAPDYSFIRYQVANKTAANTCSNGGSIAKALDWLKSNGGTPSLAAAPNHSKGSAQQQCGTNWSEYQSRTIPPDPRFLISKYKVMKITGSDGLNNLRTVIAHGLPIAFGTSLYTDFNNSYRGHPSPYVGNGKVRHDANGKKTGHAMLIVGYDDAHGGGAVKIQNSWGNRWGEKDSCGCLTTPYRSWPRQKRFTSNRR